MNTYTHNVFIFNSKTNNMKKINAFTMLEILIICILLWAWLVSIFQAANRAKMTNERVTQTIIANQLATEWVEILYQFRNTNFLKYENIKENSIDECLKSLEANGDCTDANNCRNKNYDTCLEKFQKDNNINKCRLASDQNKRWEINQKCNDRLKSWYYLIDTQNWINTIKPCNDSWCNRIASATGIVDDRYAICLKSWVRTSCPKWHGTWWDQSKYWKFYRTIRGIWIYNMASNNTWGDLLDDSDDFTEANAQEYRFCSIVARRWWQNWEMEICSTMTNFIE